MVDPTLGVVRDIIKIGMKLKKALDTIPANDMDCQELQVLVAILIEILLKLQKLGLMRNQQAICTAALVCLRGSLDGALEQVTKWQERSKFHRLLTAGDMAKQLCRVRDDIQRKMQLADFAFGASMMEVTIELTRTFRCDGPHLRRTQPQLDAAETEIYSSNSTAGGAGTVEGIDEIITMVTTESEESSAPSPSVTEFSLSETVAMHHVSGERINGGSDYTIVVKVVLKVAITCKKCKTCVLSIASKVKGIKSLAFDEEKGTLTAVGFLDVVVIVEALRKAKHPVEVVSVVDPEKEAEEKKKEKEEKKEEGEEKGKGEEEKKKEEEEKNKEEEENKKKEEKEKKKKLCAQMSPPCSCTIV